MSALDDNARRRAALSPAKQALLEQRLRRGRPGSALVPRHDPDVPAPLSSAQQLLWFLHLLDPDSAAYNVPAALRLSGRLDPEALRQALERLIERHDALRTRFDTVDG